MSTTYAYPFDPTGVATTNLITNEIQTISLPDWTNFYFLVPKLAPYFRNSLVIVWEDTGKILVEGIDYVPSHYFYEASLQCASPIYGSITILDRTIQGVLSLKYQTIGGQWTVDNATIETILSNVLIDPRVTTWEMVVELPSQFPPIDHSWDIVDLTGASDVVTALNSIFNAIQNQSGATGLAAHEADYSNPHHTTKDQVGLGSVQNYGIADTQTSQAGSDNSSYMTPLRTAQAITAQVGNGLNSHILDIDNPHETTAAQVGLGNVQNFGIANSTEATSGLSDTSYMTPLKVSQAITAQVGNGLNSHIANTGNPHSTTATQVGLGNVQNYGIANTNDAIDGSSDTLYMTPLKVSQAIYAQTGSVISNHINNFSNPHLTTKDQVGLGNVQNYSIATETDAINGVSNVLYMTPYAVSKAIEAATIDSSGTSSALTAHISNTNNPHNTTAAQVGLGNVQNYGIANSTDAVNGLLDTSYMTPLSTAQAITAQVGNGLNSHILDIDNPHETTAAQVGLGNVQNFGLSSQSDAEQGELNSSYMTPLSTAQAITAQVGNGLNSHIANVNNPHNTTAAQVGTYDFETIDELIFSAKNENLTIANNIRKYGAFSGETYLGINNSLASKVNQNNFADFNLMLNNINVIQNTDSDTLANNILTDYKTNYRNFLRLSSYGEESRYSASLNTWEWDNTNNLIVCTDSNNALKTILSPFKIIGDYVLEVELSSDDLMDQAIGLCAGFTTANGIDLSLSALRTPGGLTTTGNVAGFPGAGAYQLFTVGFNLIQNSLTNNHVGTINMGSTSSGLIWGDGVNNTDRSSSAYIPESQTTGTNGWSSQGTVRIKVTVNTTNNTITFETTNFGSTVYVEAAKVTIDLTSTISPQIAILSDAIKNGGVRWGLCAFNQPNAKFNIISAPDQYKRYIKLNTNVDGSDNSTINFYNGVEFKTKNLIDSVYSMPGMILYSELNSKLFITNRDGSLYPITLT